MARALSETSQCGCRLLANGKDEHIWVVLLLFFKTNFKKTGGVVEPHWIEMNDGK